MQEAETLEIERPAQLAHGVFGMREGDRSGVGNVVRRHDGEDVFLFLRLGAGEVARHGTGRRGRRALPAGVAVDLVVVADVEHVFITVCRRALSTAMQSSSLSYTPDRSRMRIRIFFSIRLTCTWLIPSFLAIWACV